MIAAAIAAPIMIAAAEAAEVATAEVTAAEAAVHAPGRSLGGRESREGECSEGSESEDGRTGLHGNLLCV
jgi:hypothetical protein